MLLKHPRQSSIKVAFKTRSPHSRLTANLQWQWQQRRLREAAGGLRCAILIPYRTLESPDDQDRGQMDVCFVRHQLPGLELPVLHWNSNVRAVTRLSEYGRRDEWQYWNRHWTCCEWKSSALATASKASSQTLKVEGGSPCILPKARTSTFFAANNLCEGDISPDNARLLSKSAYALGPRASGAVCGSLPARACHCRRPHRCQVRSEHCERTNRAHQLTIPPDLL